MLGICKILIRKKSSEGKCFVCRQVPGTVGGGSGEGGKGAHGKHSV